MNSRLQIRRLIRRRSTIRCRSVRRPMFGRSIRHRRRPTAWSNSTAKEFTGKKSFSFQNGPFQGIGVRLGPDILVILLTSKWRLLEARFLPFCFY